MAIVANLTILQQQELEKILAGFQVSNQDLVFKFFNQEAEFKPGSAPPPVQVLPDNSKLEEKIDALSRRLDFVFGNHIFIKGKLVSIDDL